MSLEETLTTERKPYWFQPGNNANPLGRPKGSRNKLGEQFVSALQKDFEQHGEQVIQTVREEEPAQYLRVIASLLPKQFELDGSALGQLADDQIGQLLVQLNAWLEANGGAGTQEAPGRKPLIELQALPEAK